MSEQCPRCRRPRPMSVQQDDLTYCHVTSSATCMLRERCETLEALARSLFSVIEDQGHNEYMTPDNQAKVRAARAVLVDDAHRPSRFCGCKRCEEARCRSQSGSSDSSGPEPGEARSSR